MPERYDDKSGTHHHHHHHHWRDRSGYAYRAGDPGPGPNFHRLRRNTRNKALAGVCAGLSDYFGWNLTALRWGFVLGAIFFTFPFFVYLALAIFVRPDREPVRPHSPEEERFWRTFSVKPQATFSELKHRFRALDARVGDMERAVTSDEYGLRRAFRDLERGT
ncbi:MAG: PspC domain-containing protein [Pseudomonadota bacterium]